eukprot:g1336.t1
MDQKNLSLARSVIRAWSKSWYLDNLAEAMSIWERATWHLRQEENLSKEEAVFGETDRSSFSFVQDTFSSPMNDIHLIDRRLVNLEVNVDDELDGANFALDNLSMLSRDLTSVLPEDEKESDTPLLSSTISHLERNAKNERDAIIAKLAEEHKRILVSYANAARNESKMLLSETREQHKRNLQTALDDQLTELGNRRQRLLTAMKERHKCEIKIMQENWKRTLDEAEKRHKEIMVAKVNETVRLVQLDAAKQAAAVVEAHKEAQETWQRQQELKAAEHLRAHEGALRSTRILHKKQLNEALEKYNRELSRHQSKVTNQAMGRLIRRLIFSKINVAFRKWVAVFQSYQYEDRQLEKRRSLCKSIILKMFRGQLTKGWSRWRYFLTCKKTSEFYKQVEELRIGFHLDRKRSIEKNRIKYIKKLLRVKLWTGFSAWLDFIRKCDFLDAQKRRSLEQIQKVLRHMLHRKLVLGWTKWLQVVQKEQTNDLMEMSRRIEKDYAAKENQKGIAKKIIRRLLQNQLWSAFGPWIAKLKAWKYLREVVRRGVSRWILRKTSHAWNSWQRMVLVSKLMDKHYFEVNELKMINGTILENLQMQRRDRAKKVIMRMLNTRRWVALKHWTDVTRMSKRREEESKTKKDIARKVLLRLLKSQLWNAFCLWLLKINLIKKHRSRQKSCLIAIERCILRWEKVIIGKAWNKWQNYVVFDDFRSTISNLQNSFLKQIQHQRKSRAKTIILRLTNRQLWAGFQRWRAICNLCVENEEILESKRAIARKVVLRLYRIQLWGSFVHWKAFAWEVFQRKKATEKGIRSIDHVIRQMVQRKLAIVWRTWTTFLVKKQINRKLEDEIQRSSKIQAELLERLNARRKKSAVNIVRQLLHSKLWKVFSHWLNVIIYSRECQKEGGMRIAQYILRWHHTRKHQAWNAWKQFVFIDVFSEDHNKKITKLRDANEAVLHGIVQKQHKIAIKVVFRLVKSTLFKGFCRWQEQVNYRRDFDRQALKSLKIIERCIERWTRALIFRAWNSWYRVAIANQVSEALGIRIKEQVLITRNLQRKQAIKIVKRFLLLKTWNYFERWRRRVKRKRESYSNKILAIKTVVRVCERWKKQQLSRGWNGWQTSVIVVKAQTMKDKQLKRLQKQQSKWENMLTKRLKKVALKVVTRIFYRQVSLVFERWRQVIVYILKKENLDFRGAQYTKKILMRWYKKHLSRGWNSWCTEVFLRRVSEKNKEIQQTYELQSEVFRAEIVATKKRRCDMLMSKIILRLQRQQLWFSFVRWHRSFVEIPREIHEKHKGVATFIFQSISRWQKKKILKVWNTWKANDQFAQFLLEKEKNSLMFMKEKNSIEKKMLQKQISIAAKVVARILKRNLFVAFSRWFDVIGCVKKKEMSQKLGINILKRCIGRMKNARCYAAMARWRETNVQLRLDAMHSATILHIREEKMHQQKAIGVRIISRLVKRKFWQAFGHWEHLTRMARHAEKDERTAMKVILLYIMRANKRLLAKGLRTWRDACLYGRINSYWQLREQNIKKRGVETNSEWRKKLENMQGLFLKKIVKRFYNSNQWLAFSTWQNFSDCKRVLEVQGRQRCKMLKRFYVRWRRANLLAAWNSLKIFFTASLFKNDIDVQKKAFCRRVVLRLARSQLNSAMNKWREALKHSADKLESMKNGFGIMQRTLLHMKIRNMHRAWNKFTRNTHQIHHESIIVLQQLALISQGIKQSKHFFQRRSQAVKLNFFRQWYQSTCHKSEMEVQKNKAISMLARTVSHWHHRRTCCAFLCWSQFAYLHAQHKMHARKVSRLRRTKADLENYAEDVKLQYFRKSARIAANELEEVWRKLQMFWKGRAWRKWILLVLEQKSRTTRLRTTFSRIRVVSQLKQLYMQMQVWYTWKSKVWQMHCNDQDVEHRRLVLSRAGKHISNILKMSRFQRQRRRFSQWAIFANVSLSVRSKKAAILFRLAEQCIFRIRRETMKAFQKWSRFSVHGRQVQWRSSWKWKQIRRILVRVRLSRYGTAWTQWRKFVESQTFSMLFSQLNSERNFHGLSILNGCARRWSTRCKARALFQLHRATVVAKDAFTTRRIAQKIVKRMANPQLFLAWRHWRMVAGLRLDATEDLRQRKLARKWSSADREKKLRGASRIVLISRAWIWKENRLFRAFHFWVKFSLREGIYKKYTPKLSDEIQKEAERRRRSRMRRPTLGKFHVLEGPKKKKSTGEKVQY